MLKKFLVANIAILMIAGCAATQQAEKTGPAEPPSPEQKLSKGVTLPEYETVTLDNGMEILLMEKHDVPMIAFDVIVKGGAIADPKDKDGTASLVSELMTKGAAGRNAAEFAQAVESVGGILETGAGKESIGVSGEFMARDAELMVELLGDVLMDPQLSRDEFVKLRDRSIQQIRSMKDTNLRALTSVYGDAFLFDGHPYGDVSFGSEATLSKIGYADIRRFFIEHVGADRTILAMVGDFDAGRMRAQLEQRFGEWRKAEGKLPQVDSLDARNQRRVLLVDKPDATQTYFYLGNVGVARDYPDQAALDLVNTVFGGRFTSMLNTKLRVESGLTYGAGSRLAQYSHPGAVSITSFTQSDTTKEAIDLAIATLQSLHENGLDEQQLASAKAYVLGQFPPNLETNGELAGRISGLRFYDLGRDEIDNYAERITGVTLNDARRVIDAVYPSPENLTIVMIGKADAIREAAQSYGPVQEINISARHFRP